MTSSSKASFFIFLFRISDDLLPTGLCSHTRAWEYYVESIVRTKTPKRFIASKCDSFEHFLADNCAPNSDDAILMGFDVSTNQRGNFYLQTNGESPFARDTAGAKYERDSFNNVEWNWQEDVYSNIKVGTKSCSILIVSKHKIVKIEFPTDFFSKSKKNLPNKFNSAEIVNFLLKQWAEARGEWNLRICVLRNRATKCNSSNIYPIYPETFIAFPYYFNVKCNRSVCNRWSIWRWLSD